MNLNLEQIKSITQGAENVTEANGNIQFLRFNNEEQEKYFKTGDLAYIDKDGYIFIKGRKKSVIVLKNGKNIFPEEVELYLNASPAVAESIVFGDDTGDETLVSAAVYPDMESLQSILKKEEISKK